MVCSVSNHYCEQCGDAYGPCCPGSACPSATAQSPLVCDPTTTCTPCGQDSQPCCAGSTCPQSTAQSPLQCDATGKCLSCGYPTLSCCTSGTPCLSGTCAGGTCP
jgi:hypothetical protein